MEPKKVWGIKKTTKKVETTDTIICIPAAASNEQRATLGV
jgi:hypothetical protein